MTIVEFNLAMEGHLESKGIKTNTMTWEDVEKVAKEHNISEKSYSIKRKAE